MPFELSNSAVFGEHMCDVMGDLNAVVWANHGLLTVGPDLRTAFKTSVAVESAAKVLTYARSITSAPIVLGYDKLGIDHAVGEFRTTPASSSSALIEWTYHYRPRSPLLRPIVRRFVEGVWAPYMASVLDRMVQLAERDG